MLKSLVEILRCPVTRSNLTLVIINENYKELDGANTLVVKSGILLADEFMFYPVINGIPRLMPDAVLYYDNFFTQHLPDYNANKKKTV